MINKPPGTWHKPSTPCELCNGHNRYASGIGRKCYGFTSADRFYVHCTRPEYAGSLDEGTWGFAHWFGDGKCKCGIAHTGSTPIAIKEIKAIKDPEEDEQEKIERCIKTWSSSVPIIGTPGEEYLTSRSIDLNVQPDKNYLLSESLRYHHLTHDSKGNPAPSIVASIRDVKKNIQGLHFIYLDGTKKRSKDAKISLGKIRSNGIYLARESTSPEKGSICICAGIEDGLSIQEMTGIPTIAVPGDSNLSKIDLDYSITKIYLYADPEARAMQYAIQGKKYYSANNIEVIIKTFKDRDANEELIARKKK